MIAAHRYDGEIAGLRATGTSGGLRFSFRHVGIVEEQRFRYAVVVDGELVMLLQDGEYGGRVDGLAEGAHRLEIIPLREDVRRMPDFHGHQYGRRAFVVWPRASADDVRGYQIFTDGGSGSVNYATPAATVSSIMVTPRWSAPCDTGTGGGRMTVGGGWTREALNGSFSVRVSSLGKFQHDIGGSWSDELEWLPRLANFLPGGIVVTFEDMHDDYDNGDTWAIAVGPVNSWGSGDLAEGTHLFAIKALDEAGNASSSATSERAVAIIHRPNEVTDLAVEYDDGGINLSWTLPADGDLAAVLVYSNYSNLFGRLQEYVIEEGPWVTLGAAATSHLFTPAVDGKWMFIVRTKDTAGRISESMVVVEVDTTALPVGLQLNVPEDVAVTPIAGGNLRVSWAYRVSGGLDATGFAIYRNTSTVAPVFTTPVATVGWAGGEAQGSVVRFSEDLGPEMVTVYYTVRARSASDETRNTDLHVGVPDADGPLAPTKVNVVAN